MNVLIVFLEAERQAGELCLRFAAACFGAAQRRVEADGRFADTQTIDGGNV